jgi:hypothetical protein
MGRYIKNNVLGILCILESLESLIYSNIDDSGFFQA